jgi:hypothetical protein
VTNAGTGLRRIDPDGRRNNEAPPSVVSASAGGDVDVDAPLVVVGSWARGTLP